MSVLGQVLITFYWWNRHKNALNNPCATVTKIALICAVGSDFASVAKIHLATLKVARLRLTATFDPSTKFILKLVHISVFDLWCSTSP